MDINIIPVKGYSKEEAFSSITQFRPDCIKGSNATQAWISAGKPIYGTPQFKQFCLEQLVTKTNLANGLGCYIIVENASPDTRTKPCKVIKSETASGIKKYRMVHAIHEVILNSSSKKQEIINIGPQITTFQTLGGAIKAVKELTCQTKKNYIIQKVKIPEDPVEIYCVYKPSANAHLGTYIAFGINNE